MGRQAMKIAADTNVLVRALTGDHAAQSKAAQLTLRKAGMVALTIPTLCELVWVLQRYKTRASDIAETIRGLLNSANIAVNRPAAEAGLAMLDAGGDFADGVVAQGGKLARRGYLRVLRQEGGQAGGSPGQVRAAEASRKRSVSKEGYKRRCKLAAILRDARPRPPGEGSLVGMRPESLDAISFAESLH